MRRHLSFGWPSARHLALCLGLILEPALAASERWRPNNLDTALLSIPEPLRTQPGAQQNQPAPDRLALENIKRASALLHRATYVGEEHLQAYAAALLSEIEPRDLTAPTYQAWLHSSARQQQFLHDFDGAILSLNELLDLAPNHQSARLLRADLLRVQGNFAESRRDCLALLKQGAATPAILCVSAIDLMIGQRKAALERINKVLGQNSLARPTRQWAEQLYIQGLIQAANVDEAETRLRKLILDKPTLRHDVLLLADLLLDQQRYADVLELTAAYADSDIALRHRVAADRNGNRGTSAPPSFINPSHPADQCLWLLHQSAPEALNIAMLNWRKHKEVKDARLLARAISQSDESVQKSEALDVLLPWLQKQQLEDETLERILASIHP